MKQLAVCAECLREEVQQEVFLVDSKVNDDPEEWLFRCAKHGESKVIFLGVGAILQSEVSNG